MARTLPWSIDHEPPSKRQRAAPMRRPKPERESSAGTNEESVEERGMDSRGRQTHTTPKKNSGGRTPSTSPPRAPPTPELMREGYDGDDIYVMVEDEFYTIAQSYTAHLHHAEYKRLVKQAREAAPKALPEPTSPMSNEAKKRLQMATLQKKQKDTLHQVLGKTSVEEDEEDNVIDLWSGTSLAPLMTSNTQERTSLIGLERMSSSTRAGLGYIRARRDDNLVSDDENEPDSEVSVGTRKASSRRNASPTDNIRSRARPPSSESSALRRRSPVSRRVDRPVNNSSAHLSKPEDSADVPDHVRENESFTTKSRPTARPNGNGFLKRKIEKEQDEKKSRLEDVPMFII
ncbi:uncharacterized protein Z518_05293 [Rhinocladiella mackenziei CBS 650.93]|uniref:Uncharacterized protein n=1 Tax=Rhinocladiella mackenziei CBS 650.93 TaxID=1442369 RepID=A0A0D2J5U8_9EURO|nr:uncharacterized protein Z518_05293 [Rhinocladiella mackenziei CBS 650.93]KIX04425.1 hypothetical protein Z518_05293 [Rhinocladiella mackenziei CBS 650.93]